MSKTSSLALSLAINGDGASISYVPPQSPIVSANAPEGGPISIVLSGGSNTIPVPPSSGQALVVPPSTSSNVKALRSLVGDTGVSFQFRPQLIDVVGLSNIYITSTTTETISIAWTGA